MAGARYSLELFGPVRLCCAGDRIVLTSRRAQALLAMLATSGSGERTRIWLQDRLWGSRGAEQAQTSLRRELSSLRKLLNHGDSELLQADSQRLWLDLAQIDIDLRRPGPLPCSGFLEGLDLPGEEGFEDWLRGERARFFAADAPVPAASTPAPPAVEDVLAWLDRPEVSAPRELADALLDRLARLRWLGLLGPGAAPRACHHLTLRTDEMGERLALTLAQAGSTRRLWSGQVTARDPALAPVDLAMAELRARIAKAEQDTAMARGRADSLPDLIWQSQWHMHRLNRADAARARELARQALDRAPQSHEALVQTAWVRIWDLWVGRASGDLVRQARELAQRVIVSDHEDARGHMLAGIAEIWLKQPLRAEVLLRRAIELDPSLVMARIQLSCALSNQLAVAEAEAELLLARQLSPNDQYLFFLAGELATVCLMQDRPEEALVQAETALAGRRSYLHGHVAKVNALVRLDRMTEAREAWAELYRVNPAYDPAFIDWIPFIDSSWNDFFKDGLNRAAPSSD